GLAHEGPRLDVVLEDQPGRRGDGRDAAHDGAAEGRPDRSQGAVPRVRALEEVGEVFGAGRAHRRGDDEPSEPTTAHLHGRPLANASQDVDLSSYAARLDGMERAAVRIRTRMKTLVALLCVAVAVAAEARTLNSPNFPNDRFGRAVAFAGDRVVVGAPDA